MLNPKPLPRPSSVRLWGQMLRESLKLQGLSGLGFPIRLAFFTLSLRLMMMLDRMRHPFLSRVPVVKPIFVLGTGRDGAELLKRVLSQSPEIQQVSELNRFLPSRLAQTWFRRPLTWLARGILQGTSPDEGPKELPGGDELLVLPTLRTPLLSWLTPLAFARSDAGGLYQPSQNNSLRLARFLKAALQRQALTIPAEVRGERRYLVHLPHGAAWIDGLTQVFPDAEFLVLRRDPQEAIPSLLASHRAHFARHPALERAPEHALLRYFRHRYQHEVAIQQRMNARLTGAPPAGVRAVFTSDLMLRPEVTLETLLQTLDLALSPAVQTQILQEAKRLETRPYSHIPTPSDFGIGRDEIQQALGSLASPPQLRIIEAA